MKIKSKKKNYIITPNLIKEEQLEDLLPETVVDILKAKLEKYIETIS